MIRKQNVRLPYLTFFLFFYALSDMHTVFLCSATRSMDGWMVGWVEGWRLWFLLKQLLVQRFGLPFFLIWHGMPFVG